MGMMTDRQNPIMVLPELGSPENRHLYSHGGRGGRRKVARDGLVCVYCLLVRRQLAND